MQEIHEKKKKKLGTDIFLGKATKMTNVSHNYKKSFYSVCKSNFTCPFAFYGKCHFIYVKTTIK